MIKQEVIKGRRVLIGEGFYAEFKEKNEIKVPLHKYLKTARNNLYDWKTNGMEISKFIKHFGVDSLESDNIEIIVKKEFVYMPTRKQLLDLTKTKNVNEAAKVIGIHRTQIYKWINDGLSEKAHEIYFGNNENE